MNDETRGRTQVPIFYENTFVPLASDAIISWFWVNLSHFGVSDDGRIVKTESPIFYWFLSSGI